jgi:hypothetical protein
MHIAAVMAERLTLSSAGVGVSHPSSLVNISRIVG